MKHQVALPLYNKLAEAFEQRKKDPAAVRFNQLQEDAFAAFKAKGFPTIKEEDWRFTSMAPFLNENYHLELPERRVNSQLDMAAIKAAVAKCAIPALDSYKLVLVNGIIDPAFSVMPDATQVSVKPLRDVASTDMFRAHFSDTDHTGGSAFTALNTAFFDDGYSIVIHKDTQLDKPIEIVHVYAPDNESLVQPRQMIVIENNAKAEIIESAIVVNTQEVLLNSVAEVVVSAHAHLIHYIIQNNKAGERWLQHSFVKQERTSRYDNFVFCLPNADLLRNNLDIHLDGSGTETHMYGLYMGAGKQLIDNHTAIHHKHPNCVSHELYKGVLLDHAKAVFNGKVYVDRIAQKTNAYQQNNNLLLSDKAQIFAKPQLEIFADDVKCSHGCTIGQFNPESLFYLRSRGIGELAARKLLVEAFMFDVTEKIENDVVKGFVQDLIYQKLAETSVTAD